MKTLLIPKFNLAAPVENYDLVIRLDDKYTEPDDILCFIPNRQIVSRSKSNFCFINYGPNSWQYKQNARGIGCQLGDDNFIELDTDVTYPFHKQVGLNHNEELHILMLSTLFFLDNNDVVENIDLTLLERVNMSDKENIYLQKLIDNKKIAILNE